MESSFILLVCIIVLIVSPIICNDIASKKGYDSGLAVFWGLIGGIWAIIIYACLPPKEVTDAYTIGKNPYQTELTEWQKNALMAQRKNIILTLPCSKCGNILYQGTLYCPKCGQKADWSVYNKTTNK